MLETSWEEYELVLFKTNPLSDVAASITTSFDCHGGILTESLQDDSLLDSTLLLNLVRLASFEIIEDFVECDSTSCVLVLFSTGQPKVVNTIWVKSAPFSTAWRVHDVLCLPSIELVQASDISVSATLDTLAVSPWVTSVVEFRLGVSSRVECDSTSCVSVLLSTGQRVHDVLFLSSIDWLQVSDISVSATLDTLTVSPWVTSDVEFRLGDLNKRDFWTNKDNCSSFSLLCSSASCLRSLSTISFTSFSYSLLHCNSK